MPITTVGTFTDQPIFNDTRRKAAIRASVDESCEKLRNMIRAEISSFSDTGELWNSIKIKDERRVSAHTWQGEVYSDLEYAAAIEYGWSPRWVEPETKQALKWGEATGIHFSKGHYIGGFSGHHMFQKATAKFERADAEDIVERHIRWYTGALDAGRKSIVF